MSVHTEKIIILDFGSQTTQLIARRIREQKVYSEIHPYNIYLEQPAGDEALRVSFCPAVRPVSMMMMRPSAIRRFLTSGIPVLGICYGAQLMMQQLGGRVEKAENREFGKAELNILYTGGIFAGMETAPAKYQVWMSHGDRIEEAAPGFDATATSDHSPFAALRHEEKPFVAVQFHPEVAHTLIGNDVLRNFIFDLCGCHPDWTMHSFIDSTVREIRDKVGRKRLSAPCPAGLTPRSPPPWSTRPSATS